MNTFSKILLSGAVALGSMGAFTTASARDHGNWHGDHGNWHGGNNWRGGYYHNPRVVIYPSPVYQYAPYAYPDYRYYPDYNNYSYPYGRSVVIIRNHHHRHHR